MDFRDTRTKKHGSNHGNVVQSDSISSFGISLTQPKDFSVGESFEGSVELCLNSFIVLRRIIVSLECHIFIDQRTEERPQTVFSLLKNSKLDPGRHIRLFSKSYVPFGDEFDFEHRLDQDHFVLQAGSYEYFFEFSIPRDCPPTVFSRNLAISYICTATIDCGPCDTPVECSKLLRVSNSLALKELESSVWKEPSVIAKVLHMSDHFPRETNNSGNLDVNIHINRAGIVSGNVLRLSGTVSNNSQLFVSKVDALILFFVQCDHLSSRHLSSQSIRLEIPKVFPKESLVTSFSLGSISCSDILSLNDHPMCFPSNHTVVSPGPWMECSIKCSYRFVLKIVFQGVGQLHIIKISVPLIAGDGFPETVEKFSTNEDEVLQI